MTEDERLKVLLDLFIHPGWKIVQQEMREAHQVLIETAWTVKDEQSLYKRKGEIQKLAELIAFEQLTKLNTDETV